MPDDQMIEEDFSVYEVTEKRSPYKAVRIMDLGQLDAILEWANSDEVRFSLPLTTTARSFYRVGDWVVRGGTHGHHLNDELFNHYYRVVE